LEGNRERAARNDELGPRGVGDRRRHKSREEEDVLICQLEEKLRQAKLAYVEELNGRSPWLGIKVHHVKKNPQKRSFSKLMQNAALGKLGQGDEKRNYFLASGWVDVSRIRFHPNLRMLSVAPITSYAAEVTYEPRAEMLGHHGRVNCLLYSFVTAFGRLKMLRALRYLTGRAGAELFYMGE